MSGYAIGRNKYNVPLSIIDKVKDLGKHEWILVEDDDHKYLLAGTPLAIEDDLESEVSTLLNKLSATYMNNASEKGNCDDISDIRDRVLNAWLDANDITLVYGSIEF